MIITIDGTSASGKTTVARKLAARLGFALLRTGAMYRALAYAAKQAGLTESATCAEFEPLLPTWIIEADEDTVYLNGQDVSRFIEGSEMSHLSSAWAELPAVRKHITAATQERARQLLAQGRSFVTEGRDQGSFVFPHAECKFYIHADTAIRARRKMHDYQDGKDSGKSLEMVMAELSKRDERDRSRAFAPLCVPAGAVVIDSSHLTVEQVVDQLHEAVQARREPTG